MLFRNAYWGLSTWCGHSMKILGFGKEARNVPLSGAGMGFPEVVPRISFEFPAGGGVERKEARWDMPLLGAGQGSRNQEYLQNPSLGQGSLIVLGPSTLTSSWLLNKLVSFT